MGAISDFFRNYVAWLTIPEITLIDILEIVIIAYAFYHIIIWIKRHQGLTVVRYDPAGIDLYRGSGTGNECSAVGVQKCHGSRNHGAGCDSAELRNVLNSWDEKIFWEVSLPLTTRKRKTNAIRSGAYRPSSRLCMTWER